MKWPRAATCFHTRASALSFPLEISTGGSRIALSSCAPSARFSSARPACHLPSAMPAAQARTASAKAQARGRKEYPASMRYVVIAMLLAIIGSLASAAVFMFRDRGQSKRMVKALALRVGLSVTLFLMLMAGYYFGLIPGRL